MAYKLLNVSAPMITALTIYGQNSDTLEVRLQQQAGG